MECAIISRAGQVLARGRLILKQDDNGKTRRNLETRGGKLIEGGFFIISQHLVEANTSQEN